MPDLISVIVTTYNRPDALGAVLRSLARQTDGKFEVVVADDGSGPATKAVVDSATKAGRVAITHVWHPDDGFRAAEIRNLGILAARGDYCVFLDGDCIARPDFVAAHRRLAEPGWFVGGNRVLMDKVLMNKILSNNEEAEIWGIGTWLGHRMAGRINRLMPLISLPLGPLRRAWPAKWKSCRSCNLGVWRRDLDKVDGFDASFTGWGYEDSDLIVRMMRADVKRKDGRFATGVLHLWHELEDRGPEQVNWKRLHDVIAGRGIMAETGLSAVRRTAAE